MCLLVNFLCRKEEFINWLLMLNGVLMGKYNNSTGAKEKYRDIISILILGPQKSLGRGFIRQVVMGALLPSAKWKGHWVPLLKVFEFSHWGVLMEDYEFCAMANCCFLRDVVLSWNSSWQRCLGAAALWPEQARQHCWRAKAFPALNTQLETWTPIISLERSQKNGWTC